MVVGNAPVIRKRASKKKKISWRRNVNVRDVEEFQEDQRLEERLGGAFDKRSDKQLFIVDTKSGKGSTVKTAAAFIKNSAVFPLPLKCHNMLVNSSATRDPKASCRLSHVRKLDKKIKPNMKRSKMNSVSLHEVAKPSPIMPLDKWNPKKFSYDLWDAGVKLTSKQETDWLDDNVKRHTDRHGHNWTAIMPSGLHNRPTAIEAVELPEGGSSYNPSYADHQELLWKATLTEAKKQKATRKLDNQAPKKISSAFLASVRRAEEAEGLETAEFDDVPQDDMEPETDFNQETAINKPKTRKQRRTALKTRLTKAGLKQQRLARQQEHNLLQAKALTRDIVRQETVQAAAAVRRKTAATERKLFGTVRLGPHKFEPSEITIQLSEDLSGCLRRLRPEGSIIEDRYKSLQRRRIIEPRVLVSASIRSGKRWTKLVDKRSHKMDWEK